MSNANEHNYLAGKLKIKTKEIKMMGLFVLSEENRVTSSYRSAQEHLHQFPKKISICGMSKAVLPKIGPCFVRSNQERS